MSLEIELPGAWLRRLPRMLGVAGGVTLALLVFALGYGVSPRAADGRPLLLLPDVRAVEIYRRQAVAWRQAWQALDAEIGQTLRASAPDTAGLLDRSRQAQTDFGTAIELARAVDGTEAPPALLGLHEQTAGTAQAYVDATVALNRWLSAPTAENRAVADQACQRASDTLTQLAANAWLHLEEK